jgi:fluoride ion exporter CrcB/FEX
LPESDEALSITAVCPLMASTWMLETHSLAEDDRRTAAVANVLVSIVVGLGAVALGRALGGGL